MKFAEDARCWIAALRTHYMVLLIFTTAVYFPRLVASYVVFFVAQFMRLIGRFFGATANHEVSNRRILFITDYLPPQTHGIAIRSKAYVEAMRKEGHEVVLFATALKAQKESSFDHPNIPSVVNPFNLGNRVGYTPGIKLSWYLGAYTWDVVHVVYPSLLGMFVLPLCAWRRIPVYCSHHVDFEMFARKHVPFKPVCDFGLFMYNLGGRWPAMQWATLNSAPTLFFARQHLGNDREKKLRTVPSGTHDVFRPEPAHENERSDVRRKRFGVQDDKTKVVLMVQRLSGEKGTDRVFPAFKSKADGGHGLDSVLVIAGDGPSMNELRRYVSAWQLRVVFLGNVPHSELPELYRAADCFVTMSMSETFGLTCLEAQMCGCPAVMPHCGVFDEIWSHRVPESWRYDVTSFTGLTSAIAAAQKDGREYLQKNPVRQTWHDASQDLLKQYEECISMNKERKQWLRDKIVFMDHCLRALVVSAVFGWIMSLYYRGMKHVGVPLR